MQWNPTRMTGFDPTAGRSQDRPESTSRHHPLPSLTADRLHLADWALKNFADTWGTEHAPPPETPTRSLERNTSDRKQLVTCNRRKDANERCRMDRQGINAVRKVRTGRKTNEAPCRSPLPIMADSGDIASNPSLNRPATAAPQRSSAAAIDANRQPKTLDWPINPRTSRP